MEFRSERHFRPAVAAAEARQRELIAALVPGAEVEHIGATAVAGLLTKGDLDLLARVDASRFPAAVEALKGTYDTSQPESWTDDFASFADPQPRELPVSIQLVAVDSVWDLRFRRWLKLLTVDPAVRHRYNELKRAHTGAGSDAYLKAKAAFIDAELEARER